MTKIQDGKQQEWQTAKIGLSHGTLIGRVPDDLLREMEAKEGDLLALRVEKGQLLGRIAKVSVEF